MNGVKLPARPEYNLCDYEVDLIYHLEGMGIPGELAELIVMDQSCEYLEKVANAAGFSNQSDWCADRASSRDASIFRMFKDAKEREEG